MLNDNDKFSFTSDIHDDVELDTSTEENVFNDEMTANIFNVMDGLDALAKRKAYSNSHTADGRKLRKGLVVYWSRDPEVRYKTGYIDKRERSVQIIDGPRHRECHPGELFITKKAAIEAKSKALIEEMGPKRREILQLEAEYKRLRKVINE